MLLISAAAGGFLIRRTWSLQIDLLKAQLLSTAITTATALDRQLTLSLTSVQAISLGLPSDGPSASAELF